MAYRIVWSLAFCFLLLLFIKGSWREVGRTLRDTAIGVFRDVERPSYDRLVREQVASVRASGEGDLESLVRGKHTWTVS